MECHDCREKLSAFHDGDLNSAEADRVRTHLSGCPDCAADYRELVAVVSAVHGLAEVEPPAGFLEKVLGALDEESRTHARFSLIGHLGPVLAAAASIAIIVAGIAFYRGDMMGTVGQEKAVVSAPTETEGRAGRSAGMEAVGEDSSPEPAFEPQPRPQDEPAVAPASRGDEAPAPERTPADVDAQRSPPRITETVAERPPTENPATERPRATRPSEPSPAPPASEDMIREMTAPPVEAEAEADHAVASCSVSEPERPPVLSLGASRDRGAEARYFEGPSAAAKPEHRATKSARLKTNHLKTGQAIEKLEVSFIPPRTRQVGVRATSAVEIQSATNLPDVAVRIETRNGLQVPGMTDDYVFRGPVNADVKKTVDIPLKATSAGTQRLRITVETPPDGLHSQMEATLPGFSKQPDADRQASVGNPVSVDFTEMPIRHALLEIAREGNLNLVLDSSVGKRRVTYACNDAPAGAVLRIVAEDAGYSVKFDHDTYFITPGE
ncbi:MAG: zf-HC2 domain-containing protein [Armatimonadota bacterium]